MRRRYDKKAKVNLKIYDVKNWLTNNYDIHLYNISRSKDDKATKSGQLIEYNMRNIFLKKHAKNEAGRLVPDLFLVFE